jgi:hypothetical protein
MDMLDSYIADPFGKSYRSRLDYFDGDRARSILMRSLEYAKGKELPLPWSEALIERVMKDLESVQARNGQDETTMVLPAEFQIVCQMVQWRGWMEARQYPGKLRLIREYVSDAIETSPKPGLASSILRAMVHENGVDPEKEQSAREIAARIRTDDHLTLQNCLKYLDKDCRLVTQVVRRTNDEAKDREPAYELAHGYLVGVLTDLSGTVLDETRRANRLVRENERRLNADHKLRIPVRDWWLISRHASEKITPEIRSVLNSSRRRFLVGVSVAALVPAFLMGVRYGTVHFDVTHERGACQRR